MIANNPARQAVVWLNDPLNWTNPGGILDRLVEHAWLSITSVGLAALLTVPLGLWLGHTGRGGGLTVIVANLARAIPTLALLTILPLTIVGFGSRAVVLSLAVFAAPPLLANSYLGVRSVDPDVREAARGMGLTGGQVLRRIELPLAIPYLASGLRTAAVQVVATATLAALVGGGGLGAIINEGFGRGLAAGGGQVLAGALLVAVLCLIIDGGLGLAERALTPRQERKGPQRQRGTGDPTLAAGTMP